MVGAWDIGGLARGRALHCVAKRNSCALGKAPKLARGGCRPIVGARRPRGRAHLRPGGTTLTMETTMKLVQHVPAASLALLLAAAPLAAQTLDDLKRDAATPGNVTTY